MAQLRPDSRADHSLRNIEFIPHVAPQASGSVLSCFGNTKVLCAATIEEGVPTWMRQQKVAGGWLTAEYSMLPYSTNNRKPRDISRGKLDGRSSEIQRLIGRSLRAVVDLKALGARTIWIDCDVLNADGGTRTAAITGAVLAVELACLKLIETGKLKHSPLKQLLAAVSVGMWQNRAILDLCYLEDKDADVDMNVVMTADNKFVEIQGSGEEATFSREELNDMLSLAEQGIKELLEAQRECIQKSSQPADPNALAALANQFNS